MRYLDSGTRNPDQTVHSWLEAELDSATYVAIQTAYFAADAVRVFEDELVTVLADGGEVHIVVGYNDGTMKSADLLYLVELLEGFGPKASVMLVGAGGALMHPKTYYLEHDDGRLSALVGSANYTGAGLGLNIEAGIALSSDVDPSAPFAEIRQAIDRWRVPGTANALRLTPKLIRDLAADQVFDEARPPRPGPSPRARRLFAPLAPIVAVKRATRSAPTGVASRATPTVAAPAAASGGAKAARGRFPGGAVGLIKRLTPLDTKGFRGQPGTPYISLVADLEGLLPARPAGRNDEPRLDVRVEARLAGAFHLPPVSSGTRPTNITFVGYGPRQHSHRDVRFNILKVTVDGIAATASAARLPLPAADDFAAIEFDHACRTARVTFVSASDPLHARLAALCPGIWSWLPSGVAEW